jgi:hypothetical protein
MGRQAPGDSRDLESQRCLVAPLAAARGCLCGHSPSTHRHYPTVLRIGRHFVNLTPWLPCCSTSCLPTSLRSRRRARRVRRKTGTTLRFFGLSSWWLGPGYLPTELPTSLMIHAYERASHVLGCARRFLYVCVCVCASCVTDSTSHNLVCLILLCTHIYIKYKCIP